MDSTSTRTEPPIRPSHLWDVSLGSDYGSAGYRGRKCLEIMERAMGIEPTSEAWEASILPLYDARSFLLIVPTNDFPYNGFLVRRRKLTSTSGRLFCCE